METHKLQTPSNKMMGRLSVANGADADDDAAVLLVQLSVFLVANTGRFCVNCDRQEPGPQCTEPDGREKELAACMWSI